VTYIYFMHLFHLQEYY